MSNLPEDYRPQDKVETDMVITTVQLPGFEKDDTVQVIEGPDYLEISTPGWLMAECNPVRLRVDNFFVEEFGGARRFIVAFAALVKSFDPCP